MLELSLDTWIISDTHFAHARIVDYCGRPRNHDEIMVERWNERVADHEQVFHLGDICMGPRAQAIELLSQLKGEKYYLRANHDRHSAAWYREVGFETVGALVAWVSPDEESVLFSHEPARAGGWDINIHGHIHTNGYPPGLDLSRDYRNVSVEVMDYRPWRLRDVLNEGKFQSPEQAGISEYEAARANAQ